MRDRLAPTDLHRYHLAIAHLWWVFVIAGPTFIVLGLTAWWFEANRGPQGPSLSDATSLAVSRAEEVFVYTEYGVIRAFDRNGAELRKWRVETGQGAACLWFDVDGILHVATARNDMHYEYEPLGKLVAERREPAAFERLEDPFCNSARGPSGDVYFISGSAIMRAPASGEVESVVPAPPAWLPVGPSPPLFVLMVGCFLPAMGLVLRNWLRSDRARAAA
jgi:hypothetical protein